jgi:hypothetical protein
MFWYSFSIREPITHNARLDSLVALPWIFFVAADEQTMRWIIRERPKIDRVACPWLISRFIDHEAEFIFIPPEESSKTRELDATPYDVHGVELTHEREFCSLDAFLKKYNLDEPERRYLALIVRGADTSHSRKWRLIRYLLGFF